VSKPLRTPMYSIRRHNGRTREKLECVRVSMCICYADVCKIVCVVSECERVNQADLHIYNTYSSQIYVNIYLWCV